MGVPDLYVALHPEGVDRNIWSANAYSIVTAVALHPEGVDRNKQYVGSLLAATVALHPEGVDRNSLIGLIKSS